MYLLQPPGAAGTDQRSGKQRFYLPIAAYILLVIVCVLGVVDSPPLTRAGQLLGEHWYSIYNGMLVVSAILLLLRARATRNPLLAWRVLDIAICCTLASQGLKLLPLNRPSGGPHGFPSGHTLSAFAVAWILMETIPGSAPFAFLLAVAIGWSRVEIHEHFIYQVLSGALIGMVISYFIARSPLGILFPRFVKRKGNMGETLTDQAQPGYPN